MYGRPDQVGKKVKCPDCGATDRSSSAAEPKQKNIPAALEGEQYELWDADDQPLPSDIWRAQPKYIAVQCRVCATLMYANENQVGQTIACPDCGTKHVGAAEAEDARAALGVAPDAETPRLDPAAAPGERPSFVSLRCTG